VERTGRERTAVLEAIRDGPPFTKTLYGSTMNRRSVAFVVLWCLAIIGGITGGWDLPESPNSATFPTNGLGWTLICAPFLAGVVWALLPSKFHSLSWPSLQPLLDHMLGEGFYQKAFTDLGIVPWVGVSGLLYGGVGLARSLALKAPTNSMFHSLFFISFGLGTLLFYFIVRHSLSRPREPYNI